MFPVVVSDLDGTLLNKEHQLSERTRSVVRRLSQQGVKFVFATGRHYRDVEFLRASLGIDMYLITSNGARVYGPDGQLLIQHNIGEHLVSPLLALGQQDKGVVHTSVFQGNDWLVEEEAEDLLGLGQQTGFVYELADFESMAPTEVQKVFFVADTHEQLLPLYHRAKELFGDQLSMTFSLPDCFEVMASGVSKASALKEVLHLKGVDFNEVIAFGDGLNDLQMLSQVGKGVLMGNADKQLVALLPEHEQIGCNYEDAVACYLEEHYLN